MRMPKYPPGVPSQFSVHVHPYPTRFHGPIYTRPTFGFPYVINPQSVFKPNDFSEFYEKGNAMGNGSLGDLQYNTGRGIFRPGGRGGGIFDGNIAGLGDLTDWITNPWGSAAAAVVGPSSDTSAPSDASASDAGTQAGQSAGAQAAQAVRTGSSGGGGVLPWMTYSSATVAFQAAVNRDLLANGYCPVTQDGKLGATTCGAAKALRDAGKATFPSTAAYCQSYTAPSTAGSCGGRGGSGGGGGSSSTLTAQQQAALVQQYGSGSSWKKYLVFGLGAAAVLGAAYYFEKRRRK